ncbi:MAG: methyltransferase domain-containing protein [Pseudonocardiaceae bacterium]
MYERMSPEAERRGTARSIEIGCWRGCPGGDRGGAGRPAARPRRTAAPLAPVPVRVVAGNADALPAQDATFEAAVATLVLCSVPDARSALTVPPRPSSRW